jgi:hypothetical protein
MRLAPSNARAAHLALRVAREADAKPGARR